MNLNIIIWLYFTLTVFTGLRAMIGLTKMRKTKDNGIILLLVSATAIGIAWPIFWILLTYVKIKKRI